MFLGNSVSGKGYLVMSQICYLKNALYDFDKNVVSDEVVCAGLNALTPVTFFICKFSQTALQNGHFTRTASKTLNSETLIGLRPGLITPQHSLSVVVLSTLKFWSLQLASWMASSEAVNSGGGRLCGPCVVIASFATFSGVLSGGKTLKSP